MSVLDVYIELAAFDKRMKTTNIGSQPFAIGAQVYTEKNMALVCVPDRYARIIK